MRITLFLPVILFVLLFGSRLHAQGNPPESNLVYVDKQGVLRWVKTEKEASFFGVNYTAPFAYSYRAHKALNINLEKAIQQDVYHLARLGLDAFRVHVWDTEISDSLGNLLENEHLRLFDFLLNELKKRNIRVIITPIAFWGNGYPEKDEKTSGFSRVFGKGNATANDTAIRAQENYLQQLFKHVNPYTKLTYGGDQNVIAVELNNEPSHSGPKAGVTNYINRLAAAIKSIGFTKPLYYNISQSPFYAEAVAKANIDGVSFQWYPSGLVGGSVLKGNYLPNVDKYNIPFDTIPAFRNKSRMVYEFDAADLLQSNMYPSIARSFREAGFQWATQFAYDPMALAYANTEYQTHYLNLAYTPSKAISLMIAAQAFHILPRLKGYGVYPADSVFDVFRVSYKEGLSEMSNGERFYYSNTTNSNPVDKNRLTNIAGVGSSPVIHYEGTGAYFLDKVEDGVWRLEVMPDVAYIRDPFEKTSPQKEVTRVQWQSNKMGILLPSLGSDFTIKALNEGNSYSAVSNAGSFQIQPGTYLLTKNGTKLSSGKDSVGVIALNEFVAPKPFSTEMFLQHQPFKEVSAGKAFTVSATVVGIDTGRVLLQISRLGGGSVKTIPMLRKTAVDFTAEVPAELVVPGELNYRIVMQKGNEFVVFPGGIKGDPSSWYNYHDETWQTFVAAENGRLEIFNPTYDRNARIYPSYGRRFQTAYITGETPGQLILKLSTSELTGDHTFGFQHSFTEKLKGRAPELGVFDKIIIRARTGESQPVKAKITLTDANAFSYSASITLTNNFQDIEVPLSDMVPDSAWIMPRPYPGFQPLWFKASGVPPPFKLADVEKIQVSVGSDFQAAEFTKPHSLEVASIWLQKSK